MKDIYLTTISITILPLFLFWSLATIYLLLQATKSPSKYWLVGLYGSIAVYYFTACVSSSNIAPERIYFIHGNRFAAQIGLICAFQFVYTFPKMLSQQQREAHRTWWFSIACLAVLIISGIAWENISSLQQHLGTVLLFFVQLVWLSTVCARRMLLFASEDKVEGHRFSKSEFVEQLLRPRNQPFE
ncbi:hypothetical protein KFU94_21990 [Chloroflexi bacterium TSY]|nr:hypothetical protein [Chloroflexi bacterium TSY]